MKKWSSQWKQFMQLRKRSLKKIQDFNGVWTRDLRITRATLYRLSYEATDIGSRSILLWVHMFPWKKRVLMIYGINHIWTAEMKWKWRNDRHSERNLCNSVKKPEKNSGLQRGLNPWPRDTGAMLYQLSYKATDVGSRSIVGSYVPMKEMSVNDIWNKSYMNCGNEMKMKKWSSQWTQFMQFRKEAWKKFRTSTGFESVTSRYRCDALPTEL